MVVLVTDPTVALERTLDVVSAAALALGPGRLLVQLRDKARAPSELVHAARTLAVRAHEVHAHFVLNGPADVAVAAGADGVHFPEPRPGEVAASVRAARDALGPAAFVTVAAHDDEGVRSACAAGANGVLVSPIFATPGKAPPRGLEALAAARAIVDAMRRDPPTLVYALGGVTPAEAPSCARAGADGVAAIRAIYEAPGGFAAFAALPRALARPRL